MPEVSAKSPSNITAAADMFSGRQLTVDYVMVVNMQLLMTSESVISR